MKGRTQRCSTAPRPPSRIMPRDLGRCRGDVGDDGAWPMAAFAQATLLALTALHGTRSVRARRHQASRQRCRRAYPASQPLPLRLLSTAAWVILPTAAQSRWAVAPFSEGAQPPTRAVAAARRLRPTSLPLVIAPGRARAGMSRAGSPSNPETEET